MGNLFAAGSAAHWHNMRTPSQIYAYDTSVGLKPHPLRFPEKPTTFFIEFLTDPGDTVVDIFAGSNTTGSGAEKLGRAGWLSRKTAPTWPRPRSVSWTKHPPENSPRSGADYTRTICQ